MKFDYFYNRDGERYSFYMLPKVLIYDDLFKTLSSDAKILYACLLDRTDLSYKNDWRDSAGRVFIIFTIEEIMESLNKSNKTAVKIMKELEDIGLVERIRQGLGKPNLIYVMDFMTPFVSECKSYTSEVNNLHSRNVNATSQEMKKIQRTNTNYSKTEITKTDLNKEKTTLGYFQNVYLSDEELSNLEAMLGYQLDNYIERLSSYLKSTGSEYKDHQATILSWFHKDQGNRNIANTGSNIPTLEDYNEGDFL